jgi:uncharacterized YigZ family protein
MLETYWTVFDQGTDEIVEKKSRFIAHIASAETEEEAQEFIEKIRKQYWDARHHCYAFRIGTERVMERCSDDGEPSGTAGKPMLEVLSTRGICNVVAVVVRYFGGTLLGTGGLVRAYTKSIQAGLDAAVIVEKKLAQYMELQCDYSFYGKLQYLAETIGVRIADADFSDHVTIRLMVPEGRQEQLKKKLTEASGGTVEAEAGKQVYYATVDKELIVFDEA